MSIVHRSSQLGMLVVFLIAVWFLSWEMFMSHKENWELSVEKHEVRFFQGDYPSEQACIDAQKKLPGEELRCRRVDGPYQSLNRLRDFIFPR